MRTPPQRSNRHSTFLVVGGWLLLAATLGLIFLSVHSLPETPVVLAAPTIGLQPTETPTPEKQVKIGADGGPVLVIVATTEWHPPTDVPTAIPTETVQPCNVADPGELCWRATGTPIITTPIGPPICEADSPNGMLCFLPTYTPTATPTIVPTRTTQ